MGQSKRRARKDEGLLSLALSSPWPFSATLAALIFIVEFVWLPRTSAFGHFGAALYAGTRTIAAFLLFVFSAIALYQFLGARRNAAVRADASPFLRPEPLEHVPAARPTEWSLDVLRDMEWKGFEDLCVAFYRAKGIRAESTPLGPDGGVDVRLYQDDAEPTRCTAIVQCKAWGERLIGVKLVRELRGVMAHEHVEKAFFMAPGSYTEEAKDFAQANRITLLDGKLFLAMLQRLSPESSQALLRTATQGDWTTPSCSRCATK